VEKATNGWVRNKADKTTASTGKAKTLRLFAGKGMAEERDAILRAILLLEENIQLHWR
jgi:hypothetical protein